MKGDEIANCEVFSGREIGHGGLLRLMKVTRLLEPLSALGFRVPQLTPGNQGKEEVWISEIVGLNRHAFVRE